MRDSYTIGDVMTPAPFAVEVDASLNEARSILLRERIHHLPVVDRGLPVGLVTDRDLHLVSYLANDLVPEEEFMAGDICLPDPYIVGADTPVVTVAAVLARDRIGAAMITKKNKLIGIFTTHDACRLLAIMRRSVSAGWAPEPSQGGVAVVRMT